MNHHQSVILTLFAVIVVFQWIDSGYVQHAYSSITTALKRT